MHHGVLLLHQWWVSQQPNPNYLPDLHEQVRQCFCLSWTWRF
jgi:hypothetical protein